MYGRAHVFSVVVEVLKRLTTCPASSLHLRLALSRVFLRASNGAGFGNDILRPAAIILQFRRASLWRNKSAIDVINHASIGLHLVSTDCPALMKPHAFDWLDENGVGRFRLSACGQAKIHYLSVSIDGPREMAPFATLFKKT